MKRRDFLAVPVAIPFATSRRDDRRMPQNGEPARETQTTLSGMSARALRDRYRRDLFDDFLPFMDRHVIDDDHGGFMCNTDFDGTRVDTDKSAWFEGRGIWVYSFLYNRLAREDRYLDVARKSVALLDRIGPSGPDGLWPKTFTREGRPLAYADGEIYGDLFIAEGFAEFAVASEQPRYWERAKDLLLKCVALYDRADYRPTIGQTYLGPTARPFPGARIQGVWMVLIRVATQMLERRADRAIEPLATRCVDALMDSHYNPAFDLNNELLNHDLSRPANEYAQLVYTGHCIETLWMLLYEAARRRDAALFDRVALRFKRHVEVAWDDVYGGVFRNLQHVDQNVWTLDKVLWAQEEVLIGSLFIYERTGAGWARDLFDKVYAYVRATFPLDARGSPVWMYAGDRRVSVDEFTTRPKRIENYHHPRHLMLNLLSLERLLARGDRR